MQKKRMNRREINPESAVFLCVCRTIVHSGLDKMFLSCYFYPCNPGEKMKKLILCMTGRGGQ